MKKLCRGKLSAEAQAIWNRIAAEYSIGDPAGILLLTTAMEAFDRMKDAQSLIKRHGAITVDRWGQLRANPAATLERDARAAMLSALKHLNLDIEPLNRPGRPGGT